jgi:hypothetical protein
VLLFFVNAAMLLWQLLATIPILEVQVIAITNPLVIARLV